MSTNNNSSSKDNQSMDKAKSEAGPVIEDLKKLFKKSNPDSLSATKIKDRPKTPEGGSISK